MSMIVLETHGVTKRFGELAAVDDVSIKVAAGERRALIGPNGAGKTTLFHLISGRLKPDSGRILFRQSDIGGLEPYKIARLGIARSFQITNIFPELPVRENFRLAVQARGSRAGAGHGRGWRTRASTSAAAEEILARMNLETMADELAGRLSYGDQRRVEIGLTLAMDPALVLLDEPTAGMARSAAQAIIDLLLTIPRSVTLVLIDHDIDVVFQLSDRITVMQSGRILADGSPPEIERDERVREAYFGGLMPGNAPHAEETT